MTDYLYCNEYTLKLRSNTDEDIFECSSADEVYRFIKDYTMPDYLLEVWCSDTRTDYFFALSAEEFVWEYDEYIGSKKVA